MDRVHKSLLAGFVLGAAGPLAALHLDWAPEPAGIAQRLPKRYVDASVSSAEAAKEKHLFWLFGSSDATGAAVRLLENPELFDSVFPGYREALSDQALWDKYFRQTFNSAVHSPLLGKLDPTFRIGVSWTGCFDIYERYGADIVILGTSETYFGITPALLQGKKILNCTVSDMSPETAALTARTLAASGRRAAVVVWGYSLQNAYRGSDYAPHEAAVREIFARWQKGASTGWAERLRALPELLRWEKIVKLDFDDLRDKKTVIDGFDIHMKGSKGFSFPDAAVRDPGTLEKIAAAIPPNRELWAGLDGNSRTLAAASAEADAALAEMRKLAPKVLLFIPPTTPLQTANAPPGVIPAIEGMLKKKAGRNVLVETGGPAAYGLGYADFIKRVSAGFSHIDYNHVNYLGSEKISREIAARLKDLEGR